MVLFHVAVWPHPEHRHQGWRTGTGVCFRGVRSPSVHSPLTMRWALALVNQCHIDHIFGLAHDFVCSSRIVPRRLQNEQSHAWTSFPGPGTSSAALHRALYADRVHAIRGGSWRSLPVQGATCQARGTWCRDAHDAVRERDGTKVFGERIRVEIAKGTSGPPPAPRDWRDKGTGFRIIVDGLPKHASWQDLKVCQFT